MLVSEWLSNDADPEVLDHGVSAIAERLMVAPDRNFQEAIDWAQTISDVERRDALVAKIEHQRLALTEKSQEVEK